MPKAIGEYKFCAGCKKTKHVSEFSVNNARADKLDYSCKECKNARTRKWKKENRKQVYEYNQRYKSEHHEEMLKAWHIWADRTNYHGKKKTYNMEIKNKFIEMYGGKCSCCGETRREFLTIEHINGQKGVKDKEGGMKAYRKAVEKFSPSEYDLLCMNCNFAKGKFGYCPHDYER